VGSGRDPAEVLAALGSVLPRRVTAYAVGGYALRLWNLRAEAGDADLVVPSVSDCALLLETARGVGAEVASYPPSGMHEVRLRGAKVDVFSPDLFGVRVTRGMESRAGGPLLFGNLEVRLLSPPDLAFIKLVSFSRRGNPRDLEDARRVLLLVPSALEGVVAAAREQPSLATPALSALSALGAAPARAPSPSPPLAGVAAVALGVVLIALAERGKGLFAP
jgi:hypothetical protein